ncbi:MAG: transcriptional regulator [Ignavibacteriales bacterium]|nr:MAG: transcriptional regulator [Ignavibacteriales bacterium]
MNKQDLGKILKQRRELLNIKQADLAEIAKVGLRYLIDIENGKGNPSIGNLEKILNVLGLQIEIKAKS